MNVFIRISFVLLLLFVAWAVFYLAFPQDSARRLNQPDDAKQSVGEVAPVAHQSNKQPAPSGEAALPSAETLAGESGADHSTGVKIDPEVAETLKELGKRNSEGLQAEPMPGGGSKVNLKGRYQSVIGAVIDEKGEVHQFEGVPHEHIEDDKENKPND